MGAPVTAFATIINAGAAAVQNCSIAYPTQIPAGFSYQVTDPATNVPIGAPNTPVDIAAGAPQTFVVSVSATGAFAPVELDLSFLCDGEVPAHTISGVNTLLVSASVELVADIVALALTPTNDGRVAVPGTTGAAAFAVASVNVGAGESIRVSADTGSAVLPIEVPVCETEPSTGRCIGDPSPSLTTVIGSDAIPIFSLFVRATGETVADDPARNRIFVRFGDIMGVTRGSTSVAVTTER